MHPASPFVIRSAARFFLNDGDHERALALVRRAPNVSGGGASSLGRPGEAFEAVQQIPVAEMKDGMEATYVATQGIIEYRFSRPDPGRALYEKAREVARKQQMVRDEAWSILFQAREERRFDPDAADRLLVQAQDAIKRLRLRDALVATRLLEIVSV
jgi:hypothetical protein